MHKILQYKKELIIGGIILSIIIVIFSLYLFYNLNNKTKEFKTDISLVKEDVQKEIKEVKTLIYVDIKGEVVNPGVYSIEDSLRVNDVIALAGGLTNQADSRVINLSKKVFDEMVIIIYSKEETNNMVKVLEDEQTKNETCSNYQDIIINEACIENENNEVSDKININTANKDQLMALTGIGESKALNIINYRETEGLFTSTQDITNVTGIGESIFAKIKDYITI